MPRQTTVSGAPFRHGSCGVSAQFLLFALLANALGAANLPRFAFTAAGLNTAAIAVDSRGNTYLSGSVSGSPFTATPGAWQSQSAGGTCYGGEFVPQPIPCHNAFVIKLDASGNVVFATYLGGAGSADGGAIAVDSEGNVYVSGSVVNGSFPVTPGSAFATFTPPGGNDTSFVAKLNAAGTQLEYSTLIPGALITSICVDGADNLYFTGSWDGPQFGQFPATPGAFQSAPVIQAGASSSLETIAGELNPSGSALVFGTYLSGTLNGSAGAAIALDAAGNVIVAGTDYAADFPATAGQFAGAPTVYVAKFNPDARELIYSSLLGPALAGAMKTDAGGNIYIACGDAGAAFPATDTGFGVTPPAAGRGDYLLQVSADGSTVVSSTYLPFTFDAMDVDAAGNAYIAGNTLTPVAFPMTAGAFQPAIGAIGLSGENVYEEAIVAKISPGGQVVGATYLGGSEGADVTAIAAERDGSVVVGGFTGSADFLSAPNPPAADGATFFFAANFFPPITIQNSASYAADTAVPGEMVSIRGYGIGPAAGLSSTPAGEVGGVQVYFDNLAAPIIYAQAEQINVQAPWEIASEATTQVRIVYHGVEAGSATVPVSAAMPGIFYIENSDGSFNSPSNPARAGDYVAVYGTGAGVMNPPGVTGSPWPLAPLSSFAQSVSAMVGGEAAVILYTGSAPTLGSWYFQMDVRLPADLTAAARFLCLTIGGVTGAPAAISIQEVIAVPHTGPRTR